MSRNKSLVDYFNVSIVKDFLTVRNSLSLPTGNLGIPRSKMPQIEDFKEFVKILERFEIETKTVRQRIGDMKLAQGEVNKDKVFKMMVDYRIKNKRMRGGVNFDGFPPVITNDNFILDGLHRQVAMFNINKHAYHDYTRVDASFKQIYSLIQNNPSVFQGVVRFRGL